MQKQIKGSLLLLIGTVIWGCAFVAQSVGMDYVGPFTFQTSRSVLAVIALIPAIWLFDRKKHDGESFLTRWNAKGLWKAGIFCGTALFVATGLQQMGLVHTDPGKAGFITAMYIVLVPVFGIFLGRKANSLVWISVVLAVIGLYLLSAMGVSTVNIGDLLVIGAAIAFAVQILCIDRFAQGLDGLRLNCVQFMVVSVLSCVVMLATEEPDWQSIIACALPILYTGLLSSAAAYSLQIIGQQNLEPTAASLIMSLESVFAVLAGWVVLNQTLTPTELLGCGLVFIAVILSQIPVDTKWLSH